MVSSTIERRRGNHFVTTYFIFSRAVRCDTLGNDWTAQTFMPQTIHPLAVGASRLAVGGFSLLVILLIMRKIDFRNWPWKSTLYAAISMAIFQYLFFSSVRLTGVAIGTVVTIGSAPVFSGIIEWLLVKRRPTRVWIMATALAIIGCALLFLNKDGIVVNPVGIAMSLGAGLLFAFYTLVNKDVLEKVDACTCCCGYLFDECDNAPAIFVFIRNGRTYDGAWNFGRVISWNCHNQCGIYPVFCRIETDTFVVSGHAVTC